MRVFNLAEELEKERKKNKELEKKLKLAKEQDLYGIKIVVNKEQYEAYKGTLQEQIEELQDKIDKAIDILEKRINKTENQEWKSYTGQTDEEYLQEQKELLNILK